MSRSTGRSAVAAAAYRSGERLTNARDGMTHDYRMRADVEAAFIVAPENAAWAHDRSALWNAAEAAEKRKDAKVAREYELALPSELDAAARRALVEGFAGELRDRYGVAVDVAIHAPHDYGDDRNYHAHVLTTTRAVGPEGMGAKTRQLDVSTSAADEIELVRASWAARVNTALERVQSAERVDHRSLARQGVAREPTIKLGPAAAAIERRAEAAAERTGKAYVPATERGLHNARVRLSAYVERGTAWVKEKAQAIGAAVKGAVPGLDMRALAAAAGKSSAEVTAKALAAREAAIQAKALVQAQARAVLDVQKAMGKAVELATPAQVIRPGFDRGFSR